MKGKRGYAGKKVALFLAVCLAFTALSPPALAASRPLLYRVTDDAGHAICLFGTIHIGNADMYPLSDAVMSAYEESDVLAVEADVGACMDDPERMEALSAAMRFPEGETALDHLSEEALSAAAGALSCSEQELLSFRPCAILSLLESLSYSGAMMSADWGVDTFLMEKARADGKRVEELESVEAQWTLLGGLDDGIMEDQIRLYAAYPTDAVMSVLALVDSWEKGDKVTLSGILEEEYDVPQEEAQAYQEYLDAVYGRRDAAFAQKAEEYLKNGVRVMIAIGAAHIVGAGGLVDYFTEQGYKVEEIGR